MHVSVVVSTYDRAERLATLESVLAAWLGETPDVWLADGSGRFETRLPVRIVSSRPDAGNRLRHAVATLTNGEFVVKADDDVLPHPGFLDDLRAHAFAAGGILGIIGRRFNGPRYHGDTVFFKASAVPRPTRVDFVGGVTCAPRSLLPFDLLGCTNDVEDLFWQLGAFPSATKTVIPTTRYENLPDAHSDGALYRRPATIETRGAYYAEQFARVCGGLPWDARHPPRK